VYWATIIFKLRSAAWITLSKMIQQQSMGVVCKEQSYTKRPRLPVMETGGAAVLWETPQALQSLSAAES